MCQVTVGVLGDVCRAIEDGIFPFCDAIMQARARPPLPALPAARGGWLVGMPLGGRS